jgi:hypothetical protein
VVILTTLAPTDVIQAAATPKPITVPTGMMARRMHTWLRFGLLPDRLPVATLPIAACHIAAGVPRNSDEETESKWLMRIYQNVSGSAKDKSGGKTAAIIAPIAPNARGSII